jgi:hypothetical protein
MQPRESEQIEKRASATTKQSSATSAASSTHGNQQPVER